MIKFTIRKRMFEEIVNSKNVILILHAIATYIALFNTLQQADCLQITNQQQQQQQQQHGLIVGQQSNPLLVQQAGVSSAASSPVSQLSSQVAVSNGPQLQQSGIVDSNQQQVSLNNQNVQQSSNSNNNKQTSNLSNAKSNHRLVNKIKDARHRRRNRHHRHRHYHHNNHPNNQQLGNDRQSDTVQAAAAMTLTALESIVEEVARAGQLTSVVTLHSAPPPVAQHASGAQQQQQPSQPQQQQPQQQAQQSQSAVVATPQQQQLQVQVKQAGSGNNAPPSTLDSSGMLNVSLPVTQLQTSSSTTSNINQLQQPKVATAIQPTSTGKGTPYGSRGFFLTTMLSKIMNVLNVTEFALEMRDGISSRASCMACNAVVGLFLSPLYSKDVFSAAIRTVCTSFKIQSPRVCAGLTASFEDDFEYIRKNTKLSRDEVCGVVFGVDCARRQTYNLFWTVPIPEQPVRPIDQASTTKGLTLPLSEQALTNMDDAPDLFEYRKSGTMLPLTTASLTNNKKQQSSVQESMLASANLQTDTQSGDPRQRPAKSAKLLKRPQYIFDDEFMDNNNAHDKKDKPISSFVHITDIHIDPYYEPGSLNDCSEPLCCRATSGSVPVNDKRRQAGRWGDYGNCDVPVRTLHNALNRIREQHSNAEYWLWTGDISPHDIWNITKSEAANHVRLVTKMVRDYSSGVPVFPVIGNHEAHPVNSFSPPEIKGKFSMSWLYDLLADEWSDWLPADALKTLRIGGYYKLQVRRGFRILALNTNYCARLNPWSFYDPVDPANQLKWLVDELLEAELNQDKVHIIGHVPPDNRECTQAWLFNFINIVDRFKETIVAQFYGHTHRDEWRVIYSLARTDDPIGIQFIGPSITPFTENNPSYRIYHQDKSGYIYDSETYYFNLTEANETPTSEPRWVYSYSTRQNLNLTQGLQSAEWHNYLQKLHEDDDQFDVFYKNFYRNSDVKVGQPCRSKCKYQMLSDLRLSHPYKTKPKPFLANRKTSNHHRDRHDNHHQHHHYHHRRLKHLE